MRSGSTSSGVLLSLAAFACSAIAQPSYPNEVLSLPGWEGPLPSRQFSGYLSLQNGKQLHYHFVLAESAVPTDEPVVLWLNGGPGCSSYIGFWTENGPLTMNGDGTLSLNEGRWSQVANVLYLESPVGVGFSYWPGQPLPWAANDTSTAQDSTEALLAFYALCPQFSSNDLWITGESYAGVYVPMLAQAILALPSAFSSAAAQAQSQLKSQLRGILVGNGAVATGDWYEAGLVQQRMEHAFSHGLFSPSLYAWIQANCTGNGSSWLNRSAACDNALALMSDQMGPLNVYNIEQTCAFPSEAVRAHFQALRTGRTPQGGLGQATGLVLQDRFDWGADPCSAATDALTQYLNQSDVVSALHVSASVGVLGAWSDCAGGGSLSYTRLPQDERVTVYPGLLAGSQPLHVLIFNGDQDECIPYIQDVSWTASMGYPVSDGWRPWVVDGQVAGYVTEYSSPGRFAFASVKRAGHEVPTYQPVRALEMVRRFISGQPL